MASLSELLNPAPMSKSTSPRPEMPSHIMDHHDPPPPVDVGFAPELFQIDNSIDAASIKDENMGDSHDILPSLNEDRRDSVSNSILDGIETAAAAVAATTTKMPAPAKRSTKRAMDKKDTRHSSKNEGQHTDRRYLCYLCNKLFTRRRSVRDHLSKIHNTKTWDPARSLEIVVEPVTGEPLESLEAQIARGGNAPISSTPKLGQSESIDEDEEADYDAVIKEDEESEKVSEAVSINVETPTITEMRPASSEPTASAPAPVIGKKRPLPINKKGTAKVKTSTPNKRPRLVETENRTPLRSPSVTSTQRAPSSKLRKATESPVSSRAHSIDVSPSPTSSADTPGSTNDDGEVFCICRKGDNHTWMIACDGGCEEWYHGKCVNIRERDGDLIDKYVCPKCTKTGFHTTWKRMCRRKGCRRPARVFEDPPSKYCGAECGRLFFVDLVRRAQGDVQTTRGGQYLVEMEKAKKKKRRRRHNGEKKKRMPGDLTPLIDGSRPHTPAYSDDERSDYETDSSLDDDTLPNRGGALRAGEVKAILEQCKTVDEWRELGRKPATPPREPDSMELDDTKLEFDEFEKSKLASLQQEKAGLTDRSAMLVAREALLELIKKRSSTIIEDLKKSNPKQKDLCGYDPRLTWAEEEFLRWWKNGGGSQILESGKIGPPASVDDENMTNGHPPSDDEDASGNTMPTKGGICVKNRCQRHGSNRWQKAQLAELRFEQDLVRKSLDRLGVQEKDIRDRAVVRSWSKE